MGDHAQPGSRGATLRGHLCCPFCGAYDVDRLFLGSRAVDCCECATCGSAWEESAETGVYRGRVSRTSVAIPGD